MTSRVYEIGIGLSDENEEILFDLIKKEEEGTLEGIFKNIPSEVYHHPNCPGLSNSSLQYLDKSLAHLYSARMQKIDEFSEEDTLIKNLSKTKKPLQMDSLLFGTYFHDLVLLPDLAEKKYKLYDDSTKPIMKEMPNFGRKKEFQILKQQWLETFGKINDELMHKWEVSFIGKYAVGLEDFNNAAGMKKNLFDNEYFKSIYLKSENEVTFFINDKKNNVLKKCRADMYSAELSLITDIKTTQDASFNGFRRSMVSFNYDRQAAYYTDIIDKITGTKNSFIFAAVEKNHPFSVGLYLAPDRVIEVGRELYQDNLAYYAQAKENKQESYSKEIIEIDLPAYGYDVQSRKRG